MKVTIEFNTLEEFYSELPKVAALTGFSGQFATFTHEKKSDSIPKLEDPKLPEIFEKDGEKRIRWTAEQQEKMEAAAAVSDAVKAAENTKNKKDKKLEEAKNALLKALSPAKAPAENPKEEPKEETEKKATPDITEVRQVLHAAIKAGHRDEVKSLLEELGAKNVSTLDPKKYADFIAGAKKIGGLD